MASIMCPLACQKTEGHDPMLRLVGRTSIDVPGCNSSAQMGLSGQEAGLWKGPYEVDARGDFEEAAYGADIPKVGLHGWQGGVAPTDVAPDGAEDEYDQHENAEEDEGEEEEEEEAEIFQAMAEGDVEGVERLVQADKSVLLSRDWEGGSPLVAAAAEGLVDIVHVLLVGGADTGVRDVGGQTALHYALPATSHMPEYTQSLKMVSLLLCHGAKPRVRDGLGKLPLGLSARRGQAEVVQLLLRHIGEEGVNDRDGAGQTALHCAAERGHAAVVGMLLRAQADHTLSDGQGLTPKQAAQAAGHCACVEAIEWWEAEQERLYVLQRARSIHDAYMMAKHAPAAPSPSYLAGRAVCGLAMPQVDVRTAGVKRGREEEQEEEQEERRAVLAHVISSMNDQLYRELMEGMRLA